MGVNRREVLIGAGVGAAALVGGAAIIQGQASAVTSAGSTTSSDVSFVGASSSGTRRQMILDVLEPWRSKVAAGISGKTVLVKANLVAVASGRTTEAQVLPVTHVDALRGLIDFLRSISASVPIVVGDISAAPNISSSWSTAGYTALTTEYSGVTLMDLGDTSKVSTVNQSIWKPDLSTTVTVPFSGAFFDSSYYTISICRPKTHDALVMTGTTKNILMAAPLRSSTASGYQSSNPKTLMHGRGSGSTGRKQDESKCLSYNVFQLANVLYPKFAPALCVLDAWEGMQGDGPVSGSSVLQYCAVAGTDSLAVDRLEALLMGFSDTANDPVDTSNPSYTDMRYLTWIANAGFGNYDLDKINFVLGSLSALRGYVKKYTMHSTYASEVGWTGGPPKLVGSAAVADAQFLDPRPFLQPQGNDPVAGNVDVAFSLPVETAVRLGVFTLAGVEVRQLGHTALAPGRYSVAWDGRDGDGARVPAGSYVVRLGFGSNAANGQQRVVEDQVTLVR